MYTREERHNYIKEQLTKRSVLRVDDAARELGVTEATIRRDFTFLESQHALIRNHGSASPVSFNAIDVPVQRKALLHSEEKMRIARAAAELIEENDTIIITSGSTIESFAHVLKPKGYLNVITSSIRIGMILSEKENVNIFMLGGELVKNSLSVRDAYAIEGLKNVHATKLFFGCDGLDLEAGVTMAFIQEARMHNVMMGISSQHILLTDSSKLGKKGIGLICGVCDLDTIITDKNCAEDFVDKTLKCGVNVITV